MGIISNFDLFNESEQKSLDSNYFSAYKEVPVIRISGDRSGSFGLIFLTHESSDRSDGEDVLRHEYGHTKQLQKLGVVKYAVGIFIPSALEVGGDYNSRPWEVTADVFGGVQSRNHSQENINAGMAYLYSSKFVSPLLWILKYVGG